MEDRFQWYKPGFLPALLFLTGSTVLFFSQPDGVGDYAEMIQLQIIIQAVSFAMFFLMDEGLLELNRWNFAAPLAALSGCNKFCIMLNYHWYMTHDSALHLPVPFSVWMWAAMLVAALTAFVMNWFLRRPVLRESQPLPILPATMAKSSWVYWEHVEAKWMDGILALALLIPGAIWFRQPNITNIVSASFFVPVILLVIGGFRYSISRDRIRLRWGWARIPLMNIQISDIAEVEVMESGVFRRFGGYGVRYNFTKGWGFVLRNSAVCIKTSKGRRIAFSTANPSGVAELITSARHSFGEIPDNAEPCGAMEFPVRPKLWRKQNLSTIIPAIIGTVVILLVTVNIYRAYSEPKIVLDSNAFKLQGSYGVDIQLTK